VDDAIFHRFLVLGRRSVVNRKSQQVGRRKKQRPRSTLEISSAGQIFRTMASAGDAAAALTRCLDASTQDADSTNEAVVRTLREVE
jgi:hypothetical protein